VFNTSLIVSNQWLDQLRATILLFGFFMGKLEHVVGQYHHTLDPTAKQREGHHNRKHAQKLAHDAFQQKQRQKSRQCSQSG
jgi:hypothetical protein